MSKPDDTSKKPTYEELEDRIHRVYHFLEEWGYGPDANAWVRYHTMVTIRLLTGQSLKGTLIYNKKTGEIDIFGDERRH